MHATRHKPVVWLLLTALVMQLCVGVGLDRVAWCLGCPAQAASGAMERAPEPPERAEHCCADDVRDPIGYRAFRASLGENCDCVHVDLEFVSVHLTPSVSNAHDREAELALASTPITIIDTLDRQALVTRAFAPRPPNTPPPASAMTPVQRRTTLLI